MTTVRLTAYCFFFFHNLFSLIFWLSKLLFALLWTIFFLFAADFVDVTYALFTILLIQSISLVPNYVNIITLYIDWCRNYSEMYKVPMIQYVVDHYHDHISYLQDTFVQLSLFIHLIICCIWLNPRTHTHTDEKKEKFRALVTYYNSEQC